MTVVLTYTKGIRKIKNDLPKALKKILIRREDDVIRILQNFQLGKGLDSKGKLTGTYSPNTERIIAEEGRIPRQPKTPGSPYNFQDTGDLFDEMYLFFEDEKSFSLFSYDKKALFLQEEYGDIYTLTKKNNEKVNEQILRPEMYEYIINEYAKLI